MSDDAEIRRVAANYVRMREPAALDWMLEQAEAAYAKGDADGGNTWRELAEAAAALLASHSGIKRGQ